MDDFIRTWESQLAVGRELLREAPLDAVERVHIILRQARAILADPMRDERQRAAVFAYVARLEHIAQTWEATLARWQREVAERRHAYRRREMESLAKPLPFKP